MLRDKKSFNRSSWNSKNAMALHHGSSWTLRGSDSMYCRLSSGHRIRRAFFFSSHICEAPGCMYNYYIYFVYYCLQKVSFEEVFLCFNFWLNEEGLVDLFVKQNSWAMLAQYSTLSKWGKNFSEGSFIFLWTWVFNRYFLFFFTHVSIFEQAGLAVKCFVHPIFSFFGFWYFGHFSCVIFFPVFFPFCPSCLAKCKQRLRNIFVTSSPKVTKNKKWDERNNSYQYEKAEV